MKKHNLISLMLLAPIVLWAQVVPVDSAPSDIDLSDVVIIEDVAEPIESSRAQAANALAPELTDGASTSLVDAATSPVDTVEAPDPVAAAALSGFGDIAAVRADEAAAPQPSTVLAEPEAGLDGVGEVVEILDTPTAGVVVDVQAAEVLAVASTALPSDSEVLLELPGQETSGPASVAMAAEETISVDFPDEEVRIILRNVADLFDLNLVIPDTLQGRTSVKLRNITWRQVFEVALEPLGFTYVEDRNIIRIKSIAELTTEPVDTRVFILNYARADDIQGSVSPLIDAAAGGKIQVDVRSNALVITERPSRMNRIQEVIDTLDRATDQVMIESKFIEVSNGDLSDIGVDWAYLNENAGDLLGGSGAGSGNPGFSPHPYDLDTKTIPTPNGSVFAGVDSYANGLANIAAGGASGGLVAVFSSSQFAATLTAIQTENRSKLVSNPTVVVMNNQQAVFQVGEDYPIREFSVNDETGQLETGEIDYRFVGIELDVTPSVNAAGMITLDVHPVVSALGDVVPTNVGGAILEDRIFKKRDAKTQVTIKDGYTIALGGLTAETEDNDESKIPFLGDLPFLGQLFRSDVSSEASTNLIIFLTAKTLNPDGSTYADVIDPRQLEVMQLTPAQIPGYEVPADELELIHSIEAKRAQEISKEYKSKINTAIDGPKASKARWFK
jgi:type IV pilus assembly protein PilQ